MHQVGLTPGVGALLPGVGLCIPPPPPPCLVAVLHNEPKRVFAASYLLQKHFSFLTLFTGYAHTYLPPHVLRGGEKSSSFIFSPLDLHASTQAAALSLHPKCFASCFADPCGSGFFHSSVRMAIVTGL